MSTDASSLHCPNCGAVADSDARPLPVLPAPAGDGQLPVLFRADVRRRGVLPEVRRGASARGAEDDTAVKCPACRNELQRVDDRVDGRCSNAAPATACGWTPTSSSGCARTGVAGGRAAPPLAAGNRRSTPADRVRYRPCLRCDKMMNRVNFGTLSGAVVDVCKGHGTFLDAGELHQIVAFIQGGGLERARARRRKNCARSSARLQDAQRRAVRDLQRL